MDLPTLEQRIASTRQDTVRSVTSHLQAFILSLITAALTAINFWLMPSFLWFYYPLVLWLGYVAFKMYQLLVLQGTFGKEKQNKAEAKLRKKAEEALREAGHTSTSNANA